MGHRPPKIKPTKMVGFIGFAVQGNSLHVERIKFATRIARLIARNRGGAALTRLGLAQEGTPAASPVAGEWSFTDDKGVTVTLPEAPQRIVADVNAAAPLWDFGIRPVGVFGWNASREGDFGMAGGNIDPSQVEVVGDVTEPIDVEGLVGLQPDLIVTLTFIPDDPQDYWSLAADGPLAQVQQVAPIIALSGVESAELAAGRYAELAAALGADLESADIVAAHQALADAEAAFTAAIEAKPGISALFVAGGPDTIYIANPAVAGDLQYFRKLGLTIPEVVINPENGDFWEYASFEDIGRYQTDMLFSSYRGSTIEDLTAIGTVATLPAVTNDQVFTWNQDVITSYQGLTDILAGITEAINASEIVTG